VGFTTFNIWKIYINKFLEHFIVEHCIVDEDRYRELGSEMRLGVNNITSLSAKHYCYARDFHLLPWIQTLLVKSLSAGRLFINIADRGLFWAQT